MTHKPDRITALPEMFLRLPNDEGRHKPVRLVAMTDAQLAEAEAFLTTQDARISARCVVALARWIRDHTCERQP